MTRAEQRASHSGRFGMSIAGDYSGCTVGPTGAPMKTAVEEIRCDMVGPNGDGACLLLRVQGARGGVRSAGGDMAMAHYRHVMLQLQCLTQLLRRAQAVSQHGQRTKVRYRHSDDVR